MLSLSKKTDYALIALSHLTLPEAARGANAREIAERYEMPAELLAKILQKLARAGLLTSASGPAGGYRLAQDPRGISIGSVIALIDGAPAIAQCMRTIESSCDQLDTCTIRAPLTRINTMILEMLEHISLSDITRENTVSRITFAERHTPKSPELAGALTAQESL